MVTYRVCLALSPKIFHDRANGMRYSISRQTHSHRLGQSHGNPSFLDQLLMVSQWVFHMYLKITRGYCGWEETMVLWFSDELCNSNIGPPWARDGWSRSRAIIKRKFQWNGDLDLVVLNRIFRGLMMFNRGGRNWPKYWSKWWQLVCHTDPSILPERTSLAQCRTPKTEKTPTSSILILPFKGDCSNRKNAKGEWNHQENQKNRIRQKLPRDIR
jgi:hypothetical protein